MIALNENAAKKFLTENKIEFSEIKKIAGDASFRSYYRIFCSAQTFILMFAPPTHEDIKPFVKIDEFLVLNNFSAPKIFARDDTSGFLLLEDFGDDTYGRILKISPSKEFPLYAKACDALLELHQLKPPTDLANYNHALLFREVMLFVDWYLPLQKKMMSLQEKALFKFLWFQIFDLIDKENQTLVLRDYHADNLMFLPSRDGRKQVGLLDFQDAVIGSKAYDLVSLLEDARRDLDEGNRERLFEYYLKKSNCDEAVFTREYEIFSLQRNIKIIGIFARLSLRDGKNNYLTLLPRVLNLINQRLASQSKIFFEIKNLLKKFI